MPAPRPTSRRELLALFGVAVLLRLAALWAIGSAHDAVGLTPWEWGHETACVARTLADGEAYGDPWGKGTGPSAWLTPLFPAVVALALALGGGVGAAAATVLFGVQCLVSAATACLVVRLGEALGTGRAARLAGWVFAFYPLAVWHAVHTVWDTTFAAAALTGFLLAFVRAGFRPTGRVAFLLGLAFGALVLLNPAPLALLPAIGIAWWNGAGLRAALLRGLALAGGAALVCAPWLARNRVVLDVVGLRSNLGVELHVGNNDLARGRHETAFHPSHDATELARYRELGEARYTAWAGAEARRWIEANPGPFAALCLRRALIFWLGELPTLDSRIAAGRRAAADPNAWMKWVLHFATGAAALASLRMVRRQGPLGWFLVVGLALYCVPYVLTHVSERYRFPLDPLLLLLGTWWGWRLFARRMRPHSRGSAGGPAHSTQ